MSKALIIAEKPSVANDIARALGGFTKHDEYYESDDFVLSSAVGHLLEIAAPEEYEVKRGKWSFAHLPVIPPHFDLNPIAKSESRLKVLTKLLKRKDVDRLINACDAGREGELIFRLIAQHAKAKQPVQRLWLQSMTPQAIRDGFANLRSDADMLPLADAARCRSEADWLVGINGTRAMTAFNSKGGGFFLTTVGRVQTPTLSIVVEREEKIRRFVPRDYWEVKAEFACAGGFYEGKWYDPKFKRDEFDPEKRDSRLWSLPAAETIVAACRDQVGTVSEESKPSTQLSPLLFDLTSLQREANSRFGFSAKNTLGLAQALYEKHKVLTYPRTDARALPEDYLSTVQSTLEMLKESNNYLPHAKQVLDKGWVKPNKRIFDNSKISDHFAIIPTLQAPKSLSEPEQKLYDMVVKRFLAVFFPAAEFRVTTRITAVAGHHFKTEGKVLVEPGWLQVYGRDAEGADANLVPVQKDEKVKTDEIAAVALVTKPPARYSEATLLSAMEGAGKLVEDDELREAMAAKGLGTPATRAAIIEGLLGEKYLVREGRELIPTAKAFQLMTLLRGLGVKELTAPELTGEWEYKLSQMERGNLGREAFMQEIARMTQQIVKRAKEYDSDTIPGDYATLETPCPNCGGQVKENYRRFACTKCEFSISKIPGSRQFEIAEVEELLREKTIGPLSGFRSKMGRPFSAILKLSFDDETKNYKLEFDFGQDTGGEEGEAPDFSAQEPVGACPKCKGRVFEHGMSYVCEHSVANPKTCDFRSGKVILQQEITREQMGKLLADGRTDLLPNFKSSRTGRNFKAFLVKQPDGKIGFEFEKKEPKAAAAKKTAKSATKDAETVTEGAEEKPAPARKTAARKTTARKTGS
ncbi:DNA topoisomerase III [Burkholderia contaminans FFH2055]|uniref:DNA topoisomerase III n=1 Tax=Burkholderia contaminans TaxID=488447 RepID=UPI000626651E|nr:DNA topoisomerase III [Burkholderia contaminans]KKL36668.1 DNA topoisomerase III [Burkholderia contaminans FFH2055]MEB4633671.1 DNA topoisomerase III [Burkholderia contaminans]MEB4638516.1 DNA topoisomerase III [Burkholderia contaminans]MEB4657671.1 DNA topoisomerase III [Burkholderia contaminans]MEB4662981.1 DNA topoisomerase III [Burkholderia contaminans]